MSSLETVVAVNHEPTSDEESSISDMITGNVDAIVEIHDTGNSNFQRLDSNSHRYTAVPFKTPTSWAKSAPNLSITSDPPALAVVITMYNETRSGFTTYLISLSESLFF